MKRINWRQINSQNITSASGVYAWYYENKLNNYDIQQVINQLDGEQEICNREQLIREYLSKYLFSHYKDNSYDAIIKGKLKATYIGVLDHQQDISLALVQKISNNPSVLLELKEIISHIDTSFLSPLYIGMSKNLLYRIQQHKKLIETYRSDGIPDSYNYVEGTDNNDHDFASRIIEKKFSETNLYVVINEVQTDSSMHNIVEHILNRINYPILGRN